MAKRLLAALLFLFCAGVVFWFALVHTVHRGTLAVPDLGQKTLEEARQRVHDLGLEMTVEEPGVFSTAVVPGAIALQEPPPGFHVKSGSVVTVRLSLGGKTIDVPEVRENSLNTAQREIERAGLVPGLHARVEGVSKWHRSRGSIFWSIQPPTDNCGSCPRSCRNRWVGSNNFAD
jgi:serine/threonine-protein kinase